MAENGTNLDELLKNRMKQKYARVRDVAECNFDVIGKCDVWRLVLHPDCHKESPQAMMKLHELISRLKMRSGCRVYFTDIHSFNNGSPTLSPQINERDTNSFKCFYLLTALLKTRNYFVQNLADQNFVDYVCASIRKNERVAEMTLIELLAAVDENRYFDLRYAFKKNFDQHLHPANAEVIENGDGAVVGSSGGDVDLLQDSVKVRKLLITPTRQILMAPELIMANRVLREFGVEYFLRVVIRDDDGQRIQGLQNENIGLERWIRDTIVNGVDIGERHYEFLGWSNSQLRDHACYMFAKRPDGVDVNTIQRWMGDFSSIRSVAKYMARMGQCFTQTQTSIELPFDGRVVVEEPDVEGGEPDPVNGDVYKFSDGCGSISVRYGDKIREVLKIAWSPSAYQIRYGGYKGVLCVDPMLDRDPDGPQVILRTSMRKFESESRILEIVKYSQPTLVCLNRPLVMILDQVSEQPLKQKNPSAASNRKRSRPNIDHAPRSSRQEIHRRVCDCIDRLLDNELFFMADMLLKEEKAAAALSTRTPLSFDFGRLIAAGFDLTTEPFFRGMLMAIHKNVITNQLLKQKIEIPAHLGRTMYGVMDVTGVLQPDQVFVRYSPDMEKPGENCITLRQGSLVMVTKNPCVVPGDVLLLTAVDLPPLSHLHDVIVFPAHGPRPHPNEMAGSDLDGDEYSVYWDANMMFDSLQAEKPMHFRKKKPPFLDGAVQKEHKAKFLCEFVQQDAVGRLAHAHLAVADSENIFCEKAMNIAVKLAIAVDYPKTGFPAKALTDEETPPKWADFFGKFHKPMYKSPRLVGRMYRRVKYVSHVIRVAEMSMSRSPIDQYFDQEMIYGGWTIYEESAERVLQKYTRTLQGLLDQYGIADECSLISGHMLTIRNRYSDREKEDFSFFNAEKLIESKICNVFKLFRREFFREFGGEKAEWLAKPSEGILQKASAWYCRAYEQRDNSGNRIMKSFPWIVWDILCYVKSRRRTETNGLDRFGELDADPIAAKLTKAIEDKCDRRSSEFKALRDSLINDKCVDESSGRDFFQLLFVLWNLMELEIGFDGGNLLPPRDLVQLLKDFLASERTTTRDRNRRVWKGEIFLDLLKYLAECKNADEIATKIERGERTQDEALLRQIRILCRIGLKTYHHVAWTHGFDSLRLEDDQGRRNLTWDKDEMEPTTIVLPAELRSVNVKERLKTWSSVDHLEIREKSSRHSNEIVVVVSAIGTLEARRILHEILLSENLEQCLRDNKNPATDLVFI